MKRRWTLSKGDVVLRRAMGLSLLRAWFVAVKWAAVYWWLGPWEGCDCGSEHRSTYRRAWCFDCREWCYRGEECEAAAPTEGDTP